jgi:hypothetical protein
MTTPSQLFSAPPALAGDRHPLRLQLHRNMAICALDVSWPQSPDLSLELVDLVDSFPVTLGDGGSDEADLQSYWNDDGGSWWDPQLMAPSERI